MQLQQFLKAQRMSQKQLVQREPPPLNKMQYFAIDFVNDNRTEYQKQQQAMHVKMMQERAIINNSHTNNNSIPEDSPNPMDFLEVSIKIVLIFFLSLNFEYY